MQQHEATTGRDGARHAAPAATTGVTPSTPPQVRATQTRATAQGRLGAHDARRWAERCATELGRCRDRLDAANVFPVADSDTGTNLWLTVSAGARAIDAAERDGVGALQDFARGALLAARGNSGIIASEYLRGFATGAARADLDAPARAAHMLTVAASAAHDAVARPVPGTILTAAASAAAAAVACERRGGSLTDVLDAAVDGAREALLGSPEQLDVLAANGVLDAGAYGLTIMLAALRDVVVEREGEREDADLPADLHVAVPRAREGRVPAGAPAAAGNAAASHGPEAAPDGAFEVMYVVETDPDDDDRDLARRLRGSLERTGESVVVVGGDGVWQVHVHTDDPAAALDAAPAGRLRQVCVRHLVARGEDEPGADVRAAVGVVAGVRSPGLLAEAAGTGAVVLARTDRSWTPDELARVLEDAGRDRVVAVLRRDSTATLRRTLHRLPRVAVDMIVVPDDVHVVAALAAREEALDAGADAGAALAAMRAAVDALVWVSVDLDAPGGPVPDGRTGSQTDDGSAADPRVLGALGDLAARVRPGGVGLAMVLVGGRVPPGVVARCETTLRDDVGLEVLTLASGRRDAVVRVGAL